MPWESRGMIFSLLKRRLLHLIPVVLGATFLGFCVLNLLPGDTAVALLGPTATPQQISLLQQQLGLNQPLLIRYVHWLFHALQGNLGNSLASHQAVSSLLAQRAPVSIELGVLAILIALVTAVPTAILAARHRGSWIDRIATAVSMAAISMPSFVLALILVLAFAINWHVMPPSGYVSLTANFWSNLHTMVLPAVTLSTFLFAVYVRVLRGDMVHQLESEPYVEAARAKGLSERKMILRHIVPNSIFGLITVIALNLGTLIGGAVITEQIFALPGMGQMLVSAIYDRDPPVVQGIVVCLAVAVVAANLVADILYAVLDPRLRDS